MVWPENLAEQFVNFLRVQRASAIAATSGPAHGDHIRLQLQSSIQRRVSQRAGQHGAPASVPSLLKALVDLRLSQMGEEIALMLMERIDQKGATRSISDRLDGASRIGSLAGGMIGVNHEHRTRAGSTGMSPGLPGDGGIGQSRSRPAEFHEIESLGGEQIGCKRRSRCGLAAA